MYAMQSFGATKISSVWADRFERERKKGKKRKKMEDT